MISKRVFHELTIVIHGVPGVDETVPPRLDGAVVCYVDGSWLLRLENDAVLTGDRDSGGRDMVSTILRRFAATPTAR